MTIKRKVFPAGAEALPGPVSIRMAPDRQGRRRIRPESSGIVPNCPESSGFVRKRPESSGIVPNGREMSRNVKVRCDGAHRSDEKPSVSNELSTGRAPGAPFGRTRRKYGDWQQAAELLALGRTPLEVADSLGVPLAKVMRNLRESRRLRRWIAEHSARQWGRPVEWRPPSRALRPMRHGQRVRAEMPVPIGGARRSSAKVPRD